MDQKDYLKVNKSSWNERVETHLKSEFYDLKGFRKGKTSLKQVELGLLGDIKSKKILHLQCHFGQDTISLARMGAEVTGVDFSDEAIKIAKDLAGETKANAKFICCDIYSLPNLLDEKFDIVFTSYGTIGWLPDINQWAQVVSNFLKPNGQFIFVEFHPVVWMFDNDFEKIEFRYFCSAPIIETENGTYANKDADIVLTTVSWNHGLSEVISSLIKSNLEILHFEEYDYSPYDCFKHAVKIEEEKYRIAHLEDKIPMLYAIKALKK